MTSEEAVAACEFWTTNMAESMAMGSTTSEEVATAFGATVSLPRCQYSDPQGTRNWQVNVGRWISVEDEQTGEREVQENPVYTMIAAEIERRKVAAA